MRLRWLACLAFVLVLDIDPAAASGLSATGSRTGPLCTWTAIKGTFGKDSARYEATGTCLYYTRREDGMRTDPLNVHVSAQGSVEYGRGRPTIERLKITPPYEARNFPPHQRPVGDVTATWNCFQADKWLEPNVPNCWASGFSVTGNLDKREVAFLYGDGRGDVVAPISSSLSPAQRTALLEQRRQALDPANMRIAGAKAAPGRALEVNAPRVAAPAPGSRYRAETPLAIRVVPPAGTAVQAYVLQLERRNAAGAWELVTNLPAPAAQAEAASGFSGFGAHRPGTPASMQASPGAWRVRAQVSSPGPSKWSTWNEFTVVAADSPRLMTDALRQAPAAPGGVSSKLKAR